MIRSSLIASAPFSPAVLGCTVLLLAVLSAPAQSPNPGGIVLDPVAVFGSRLQPSDLGLPQPVAVIDRAEIERSGRQTVAEIFRERPEITGFTVTDNVAISLTKGVQAPTVRGLSAAYVLVLVDGRRTTVSANSTYFDLNRIPTAALERIELLKGPAAAQYGSDALAGVINLVTRRDYQGCELTMSYGNTTSTDAAETQFSAFTGAAKGKLSLTAGLSYFSRHSLEARDRYFSRTANLVPRFTASSDYYAHLPANEIRNYDGRSLTGPNARFQVAEGQVNGTNGVDIPGLAAGTAITALPGTGADPTTWLAQATPSFDSPFTQTTGGQFDAIAAGSYVVPETERGTGPSRNLFDYQDYNGLVPAADRYGASMGLRYAINDAVEGFTKLLVQSNRSQMPFLPVGTGSITIPRTQRYNPFGVDVVMAGWRITELGPRISSYDSQALHAVVGLRGTWHDFHWNTALTYSRDAFRDLMRNAANGQAVAAALTSGALNPFGGASFANDPAALDAVRIETELNGVSSLKSADFSVAGAPFDLWAGPVQVALSGETRREDLHQGSDALWQQGIPLGQGQTGPDTDYARRTVALSGEVRVPLLGREKATLLELSAAARSEYYDVGSDSGVRPAVGLTWRPVPQLTLRASWSDAFRNPSLLDLYAPQSSGYANSVPDRRRPFALTQDPFDGSNVSRLVRSGGNPDLEPEEAQVRQVGLTYSVAHNRFGQFEAEVSYYRYDLQSVIGSLGLNYILTNELGTAAGLVERAAGSETFTNQTSEPIQVLTGPIGETTAVAPGQAITVPGQIVAITDYLINISRRRSEGFDLAVTYHTPEFNWGRINVSGNANIFRFLGSAFDRNSPYVGPLGSPGSPRWRAVGTLSWSRANLEIGASVNYLPSSGGYAVYGSYFKPYAPVALRLLWQPQQLPFLRNTTLAIHVEDVCNAEPPLVNDPPIGYTYGTIGRPQGRFWRLSCKRAW